MLMVDEVEVARKDISPSSATSRDAYKGCGRKWEMKEQAAERLQQRRRRESWCNCVTAASASSPGALEEEEGWRDGGFMNNASHHWRNKDKINPPPHKHRALFLINFTFII